MSKSSAARAWRAVGMAVVSQEYTDTVKCSCGWRRTAKREKVREDAIDRHFNKRHGGQGIRL